MKLDHRHSVDLSAHYCIDSQIREGTPDQTTGEDNILKTRQSLFYLFMVHSDIIKSCMSKARNLKLKILYLLNSILLQFIKGRI